MGGDRWRGFIQAWLSILSDKRRLALAEFLLRGQAA